MTVALAGNPNVGKSTIFNALTGTRQHTGNWPGKTVEKKEGSVLLDQGSVIVVDLPGTYSLTAYSIEEIISRNFLVDEKPSMVIIVVDASNLERNLYLVMQVLELGMPAVIALNMLDMAGQHGIRIDSARLSAYLGGVPIIETIGSTGDGIDAIRRQIRQAAFSPPEAPDYRLVYAPAIEKAISDICAAAAAEPSLDLPYPLRWLAIKLLEGDPQLQTMLEQQGYTALLSAVRAASAVIEAQLGEEAEILITDERYMAINRAVGAAVTHIPTVGQTMTERIDGIVTHRLLGIPIFLLLMWIVFQFTANVSAPLVDWIDHLITGPVTSGATAVLRLVGLEHSWIESLLLGGILAGVGGVLVFIPVLASLYVAIAILEDSGYMARAAFVMDRGMRLLGLHGKSFLPMLIGFGCTVPAVYATRTLENEQERKLTGFLLTFMSCGARLPIYVVFGAAFFGARSGTLIFGMYLLGIAVALLTGLLIRRVVLRHAAVQPFVMELPAYRRPRVRDVLLQTWERTSGFVRKATSVIMAMSILVWFLLAIPVKGSEGFNQAAPENSLFGQISQIMTPIFAPAGFSSWETSGALISGIVAKEVVIGTMSQVYLGGDNSPVVQNSESFGQQFITTAGGLGKALALMGQEIINIAPRAVNLIPGISIPELAIVGGSSAADTTALEAALARHFTPLSAVAFTAFVLLYVPCVTSLTAMRHEFGTRWVLRHVAYTACIAWLAAVVIFQGGTLLGGLA